MVRSIQKRFNSVIATCSGVTKMFHLIALLEVIKPKD